MATWYNKTLLYTYRNVFFTYGENIFRIISLSLANQIALAPRERRTNENAHRILFHCDELNIEFFFYIL